MSAHWHILTFPYYYGYDLVYDKFYSTPFPVISANGTRI